MRIGLASDTYGNVDPLERAFALFQRVQVERVFFLGGRVADVDAVLARRAGGSRRAPVPQTDGEFLSAVRGALERQSLATRDPLEGRIVRVASRACPEYESGKVPRKQVDLLEGWIGCLVHDRADLSRDDISNAALLFHGNAAAAGIVQIGPRCFVTPGHLRTATPEGRPATFAIAEVSPHELVLTVYSDACAELRQDRVRIGGAGKMTVR
ncbi:MAG TPA: metallophosphoesterase family protein [Anaeromyxobacter sp.]